MQDHILKQLLESAVFNQKNGNISAAESLYRQVIAAAPNHGAAMHGLGLLLCQSNRIQEGLLLLERSVSLNPTATFLTNYAAILRSIGRPQDAADACRKAIAASPSEPVAYCTLGICLQDLDDGSGAIAAFREAVAIKPDYLNALTSLGASLCSVAQYDEAMRVLEKAVALAPNSAVARHNLGVALYRQHRLDDAIARFRKAIELDPNYADAHHGLADALKQQGQIGDAMQHFVRAVQINPNAPHSYDDFLVHTLFEPAMPPQQVFAEHIEWAKRLAEPLTARAAPHTNDRTPSRRIRIGYSSPSFSRQVIGHYIEPIIARHNKTEFEVFCYSDTFAQDDFTDRFRRNADVFRETTLLSDEQLATQVRADQIDIFIDLTLHSAQARLLAFARRPAPVQVTYLAYPGTSGMKAMDYHIADPYINPPGGPQDAFYTEKVLRLPHSFWCYQCTVTPPEIGPLPADANGFITFGSLNNMVKHSPAILRWWGELLRAVPNSRLALLLRGGLAGSPSFPGYLASLGLDPARVIVYDHAKTEQYLRLYNNIDIGLDPLPYAGHTTSFDAIYMGVPVISLPSDRPHGRAGLTIATALKTPELIAASAADYIKRATDLASDLPRLREYRQTLRGRMEASPLMDAAGYTRDIETLYRRMWAAYCKA